MNLYELKQMNKSELAFTNFASEMLLYGKNAITGISVINNYRNNPSKSYVEINVYNPFQRKSKTRHYSFNGDKHIESADRFIDMIIKAFNCGDMAIERTNESQEVF